MDRFNAVVQTMETEISQLKELMELRERLAEAEKPLRELVLCDKRPRNYPSWLSAVDKALDSTRVYFDKYKEE